MKYVIKDNLNFWNVADGKDPYDAIEKAYNADPITYAGANSMSFVGYYDNGTWDETLETISEEIIKNHNANIVI